MMYIITAAINVQRMQNNTTADTSIVCNDSRDTLKSWFHAKIKLF